MENQELTGNVAFDKLIESAKLLHEYIQEKDDETTFAIVLGGALTDQNMMHCINVSVGNLNNPPVFEAALQSLVSTMKESRLITELIIAAYHSFRNKANVKVVKLSVDSPLEAISILKGLLDDSDEVDIDEIPQALFDKIVQSIPPSLRSMIHEHDCGNPDCMITKLRRRMNREGEYIDFSELFNFGKNNEDKRN